VNDLVDRLDERLWRTLEWSAWGPVATPTIRSALVLKVDGKRERRQAAREIEPAAGEAYRKIRERRREWSREQERDRAR
jgi:hypothetical protein